MTVNALKRRDSFPMPLMDKYIDSSGRDKVLYRLDAKRVKWPMKIDEEDREETAFSSYLRHQVYFHFIWIAKRTWHLSTHDGRHTVTGQVEALHGKHG